MGVLPNASGVAVHDFWKPYQKYDNVDHAMCCAHLERELVYAHETGNQAWAKLLRELLQTLCHRRKVLQSEWKEAFPAQELAGYLERYDKLVDEGLAANPIPERTPGKRGRRAKCPLEASRAYIPEQSSLLLSKHTSLFNPIVKNVANISGTPTTIFIENGEEKSTLNRLVGNVAEYKLVDKLKTMGYINE